MSGGSLWTVASGKCASASRGLPRTCPLVTMLGSSTCPASNIISFSLGDGSASKRRMALGLSSKMGRLCHLGEQSSGCAYVSSENTSLFVDRHRLSGAWDQIIIIITFIKGCLWSVHIAESNFRRVHGLRVHLRRISPS